MPSPSAHDKRRACLTVSTIHCEMCVGPQHISVSLNAPGQCYNILIRKSTPPADCVLVDSAYLKVIFVISTYHGLAFEKKWHGTAKKSATISVQEGLNRFYLQVFQCCNKTDFLRDSLEVFRLYFLF